MVTGLGPRRNQGWGTGAPVLSAPSASMPPPTVPRSTCWPPERYPFADLPRQCVGLDGVDDLLATML